MLADPRAHKQATTNVSSILLFTNRTRTISVQIKEFDAADEWRALGRFWHSTTVPATRDNVR